MGCHLRPAGRAGIVNDPIFQQSPAEYQPPSTPPPGQRPPAAGEYPHTPMTPPPHRSAADGAPGDYPLYPSWRALGWFGFYRLALALGLCLVLFIQALKSLVAGFEETPATVSLVITYLALVLLGLALTQTRRADKAALVHTGVFLDLLVFSLLMHQGGGINSSFGLPMGIAVAAGALLMEGRLSLLFAAFATTGIMAVQIHAQLSGLGPRDGFTQAGLLGATYFMVAILAHVLYRRLQAAERLAASRQVDIDDLHKLNAFIIQRMGTGVLVVDEERRIRLMNTAASELLGTRHGQPQSLARIAPELVAWLARQAAPGHVPDRDMPAAGGDLDAWTAGSPMAGTEWGPRARAEETGTPGSTPSSTPKSTTTVTTLSSSSPPVSAPASVLVSDSAPSPATGARPVESSRDATLRVGERDLAISYLSLGREDQGAALLFLRDQRALLQEAQEIKLAALGRLTASIAHNIRNPLSAVNHASQLLAESPDLSEEDRHLLTIIARNSGRIDGIIESVLQLSRGQPPQRQSLDLPGWLEELHAELSETRRLPAERFRLDVAGETPPVQVNAGHLHQIITNLCDNALKYATKGDQPPQLTLSAGPLAGTSPPTPTSLTGAFIEVSDDGVPIDPEVAREMFTPFYTTSVSGTGLGLYIALRLAAINGLSLEYRVTPAGGNGFRLLLPAAS